MRLFPDKKILGHFYDAILLVFLVLFFCYSTQHQVHRSNWSFCGFGLLHLIRFGPKFGDCQLRVIQESFHCNPSLSSFHHCASDSLVFFHYQMNTLITVSFKTLSIERLSHAILLHMTSFTALLSPARPPTPVAIRETENLLLPQINLEPAH